MTEHSNGLGKRTLFTAVIAVILALGLMVPAGIAQADPASSKQAEAQAALDKLNQYKSTLSQANANYEAAATEQMEAQAKVEESQAKIDDETAKIQEYQAQLGTRARSMYRSGGTTMLDVFLGSNTFQEFATNFEILNTLNEKDAELVQKTKTARQELESAKAEYEAQEQVAAEKAAEAKAVADSANATAAEMQSVYDSLSAEAQALVAQQEAAAESAQASAAQDAISSGGGNGGGSGGGSYDNDKTQTVTGNTVVDRAYSQIGKPYSWGAVGPNSFDCSGLVSYCLTGSYSRLGTTYTFLGWTRVSNPQPGDICVNENHCGIYIGGGQMIHAPYTGSTVRVGSVQSSMVYVRY